jgi:hypothetical protein
LPYEAQQRYGAKPAVRQRQQQRLRKSPAALQHAVQNVYYVPDNNRSKRNDGTVVDSQHKRTAGVATE